MSKLTPGWFKEQVALAEADVENWPDWLKHSYEAAKAQQVSDRSKTGMENTDQPVELCREEFEVWFANQDMQQAKEDYLKAFEKHWMFMAWQAAWEEKCRK